MTEHEPDPGALIERFYARACQGLPLDLSSDDPAHNQSVFGATWPEDRTIPAAVIVEVAARAREPSTSILTLHVRGARIIGALDLMRMTLTCPLMLDGCWLEGPLMLQGCELASLRLAGCTLNDELDGRGMTIRTSVELNQGLVALDQVSLDAAKVGTWLDCTGGHFHSRDGIALSATTSALRETFFAVARGATLTLGVSLSPMTSSPKHLSLLGKCASLGRW
jgi:hypothetical protein